MSESLRIVIIKPSKYLPSGYVERFRKGFMPNSTVAHIGSLTPRNMDGVALEVHAVDEYIHGDLRYLKLFEPRGSGKTLVTLVGVQSHQFHRALDLAAIALENGCMAVIGGPHPMTCDTSEFRGSGVSFALAEAELVWKSILSDAIGGELKPVYGSGQRWADELDSPVVTPPAFRDMRRYVVPMLGLHPSRGCPYLCSFCSVIKIAGRQIRSQSVETTLASLRAAKDAGIRMILFTSDNFNKYPEAADLLKAMIAEGLRFKIFVQCDTQVVRQEDLVALLGRAGCWQMFVGVESFNRATLVNIQKNQNRPELYRDITTLCTRYGIESHFSNIIGFPGDSEADIQHHLELVKEIRPNFASFYILCPIPGTQQYDEFLADGLIVERNLDRFDATHLTWRHPTLSASDLRTLLFECYKQFYSAKQLAWNWSQLRGRGRVPLADYFGSVSLGLFHRLCGHRGLHPMSGGFGRVTLDGASDYKELRLSRYGIDLAELPRSIELPTADKALA